MNHKLQQAFDDDNYADYLEAMLDERPRDRPLLRCPACQATQSQGVWKIENEYERRPRRKTLIAVTYRYVCCRCSNEYEMRVLPTSNGDCTDNLPWSPPFLTCRSMNPAPLTATYELFCSCGETTKLTLPQGTPVPLCQKCHATVRGFMVEPPLGFRNSK